MIKLCIISGIAAAILAGFFIAGYAGKNETVNKSITTGNAMYAAFDYEAALYAYGGGIEKDEDNKILGFNAAQAAYAFGAFDLAAACYERAAESIDKYLGLGNACYELGEATEDPEEQLQFYLYALQAYCDGIVAYPENVELKYNYEFVSALIDVSEESEESEESEDSEQEDGEGEEGEEGDEQERDEGEGEDGEEGDSESGGAEDEDEQPEQDEYEPREDDEDENEELSREEIERILAILESREEESLKNNRELKNGEEGRYGW